jgi:hypothetical protein
MQVRQPNIKLLKQSKLPLTTVPLNKPINPSNLTSKHGTRIAWFSARQRLTQLILHGKFKLTEKHHGDLLGSIPPVPNPNQQFLY